MNGCIARAATLLCGAAVLTAGGCHWYQDLVDPCYPERYEYMARKEVHEALAPQVNNGHVLDQTIWNYHFEPGTDRLTPGGLEQLAYLARRRPQPDPVVYLQTAQDVAYDPASPDRMVQARTDLDDKRAAAIKAFLTAQTANRPAESRVAFVVQKHDPADVSVSAIGINSAVQQMLLTRFRGGLLTGGGGGAGGGGVTGGAGVGGR
jgi:hypothetical protein